MPAILPPSDIDLIPGDFTLATLPNAADYTRKFAWVTDLFDGQGDRVISSGTVWKPVRPFAVKTISDANADRTLTCMVNCPTVVMKGSLTAARKVSLGTAYAYPGASFRIKREATGVLGLLVATTIGGATIGTLSLNSWADFEYDGTNWVQTASGGLL